MTGGLLIREARLRAGLTQQELAERLATTQPVVARWEAGRSSPTLETVVRAVRACGLDLHVSLARYDHDDDRLIDDQLGRTPAERLDAIENLLRQEEVLRRARRVG